MTFALCNPACIGGKGRGVLGLMGKSKSAPRNKGLPGLVYISNNKKHKWQVMGKASVNFRHEWVERLLAVYYGSYISIFIIPKQTSSVGSSGTGWSGCYYSSRTGAEVVMIRTGPGSLFTALPQLLKDTMQTFDKLRGMWLGSSRVIPSRRCRHRRTLTLGLDGERTRVFLTTYWG